MIVSVTSAVDLLNIPLKIIPSKYVKPKCQRMMPTIKNIKHALMQHQQQISEQCEHEITKNTSMTFTTIAIYFTKEIFIDVINRIILYLMLLLIIYFLHISFFITS